MIVAAEHPVDRLVSDALSGFARQHADRVALHAAPRVLYRAGPAPAGKVALIAGGGSGHEPLHIGFVGRGMLDAACPGEVFTSPTPEQVLTAYRLVAGPAGALMVVKNYPGDVMNFDMALEAVAGPVDRVLVTDDVATRDGRDSDTARGLAGTVVVEKIVGAAAERGADLAACARLGRAVVSATGSLAVAFSGAAIPFADHPPSPWGPGEIEVGVGIHGEPGRRRGPRPPVADLAETLVAEIVAALGLRRGQPVMVLVNDQGGLPAVTLHGVAAAVDRAVERRGLVPARRLAGTYCTTLDMNGCSVTLTVVDEAWLPLWDAPADTVAWSRR